MLHSPVTSRDSEHRHAAQPLDIYSSLSRRLAHSAQITLHHIAPRVALQGASESDFARETTLKTPRARLTVDRLRNLLRTNRPTTIMHMPSFLRWYLTGGSNPPNPSCLLVISSGGKERTMHVVPEDHTFEKSSSNLWGTPQTHREHGMRERSHEVIGEIVIDEPISKALKDVYDQIRLHVQTTLAGPDVVKGDVRIVEQALRSATAECLNSWAEKKRGGRDGQVVTIVLMQIIRKSPGMFMERTLKTWGPHWKSVPGIALLNRCDASTVGSSTAGDKLIMNEARAFQSIDDR